jgi:hypothetical protein
LEIRDFRDGRKDYWNWEALNLAGIELNAHGKGVFYSERITEGATDKKAATRNRKNGIRFVSRICN